MSSFQNWDDTGSMSKGPAAQLRAVRRQLCEDTIQQKELLPTEGEIAAVSGPNQPAPPTLHLLFYTVYRGAPLPL